MEYYIESIQLKVEGMDFHVSKSLCHLTKSEFTGRPYRLEVYLDIRPKGTGADTKISGLSVSLDLPIVHCIAK